MKFFETLVNFGYSWSDVANALIRRYPNPYSKHVLSEDVIDRRMEDGKLYTVKLLTKTNHLPKWGERFYKGPSFITIIEESIVDPVAQTYTTYTRNISMSHFMSCTEKCAYAVDPANSEQTLITKMAWLESELGYGFRIPVLKFSLERYKVNQNKATLGLEHVINDTSPRNLRTIIKQSKDIIKEKAIHSKEVVTHKAEEVYEKARNKADHMKTSAEEHKISCTERCHYATDSNDKTVIEKKAWFDSDLRFGLQAPVLKFSLERYKHNQHKATLGLEHVLNNTEPRNLRNLVKHSKEKFTETAKHSKELFTQKAKLATEMAKTKAEQAKSKAGVSASEIN